MSLGFKPTAFETAENTDSVDLVRLNPVKLTIAGRGFINLSDTSGETIDGVMIEEAKQGNSGQYVTEGTVPVICGAAIAIGVYVMSAGSAGKLIAATTTKFAIGYLRTASAADGDTALLQIDRKVLP